jgi:hypothetical protein
MSCIHWRVGISYSVGWSEVAVIGCLVNFHRLWTIEKLSTESVMRNFCIAKGCMMLKYGKKFKNSEKRMVYDAF